MTSFRERCQNEATALRLNELCRLKDEEITTLRAKVAELESRSDDIQDIASKALRKAWQLGQTYWQQVDSEYSSQWKKGEITQAKFMELIDETRSAIDSAMKGEK